MSSQGEFQLIDWIKHRAFPHSQVAVGIGDDAALLTPSPGEEVIVTTDMLMDGRHFLVEQTSPELIGRKALAVNLSDIAAMAGRPLAAFVSWALPRKGGSGLAQSLFQGMTDLAQEFQVAIAGGDTNSWDGPLVVNVTLIGETVGQRRMLRSGARPGDWLFVTGPLGGSLGGRHLTFTPRLREAQELTAAFPVTSMLDVSDGIASDLRHILNLSHVGAVIDSRSIPIHDDVDRTLSNRERILHALTDGEDFELLFTVPASVGPLLMKACFEGWSPIRIGEIEAELGCRIQWPHVVESLARGGWEHSIE